MKYPVELSEKWKREIGESLDTSYVESTHLEKLIQILFIYDLIIAEINSRKRNKPDQLIFISRYFLAHEYHLGCSIYELVKKGFGTSCIILVRSMLENLIDFSYLWLSKKINKSYDERQAWLEFSVISRASINTKWTQYEEHALKQNRKVENNLFDPKIMAGYLEAAETYKIKYNGGHWAKYSALDMRARQVDSTRKLQSNFDDLSLEFEYISVYKFNSEAVHGESSSILGYIEGAEQPYIEIGPRSRNIQMALGMACHYLLIFASEFTEINRLKINILDQINYLNSNR